MYNIKSIFFKKEIKAQSQNTGFNKYPTKFQPYNFGKKRCEGMKKHTICVPTFGAL